MGIQDLFVAPFYFLLILFIGNSIKGSIKNKEISKYFLKGLLAKLIGATAIGFIYFFYYGTGDTVYYFKRALIVDRVLFENFFVGLKLLFANTRTYDPETYGYFRGLRAFDLSSFTIVRMTAITNLVCFGSYLGNAYIFSALSYIGIWRVYKLFTEIFPGKEKLLAISFLFIPSVFFWGSGVLKDNVTYGFLGLLISSFYYIFFKRKNLIRNIIFAVISLYIIGVVKSYVLMATLPAFSFWLFFTYRNKINNGALKALSTPIMIALVIGLGFGSLKLLGNAFSKFSIDNAQERAQDMQRWHTYRVEVLKGGDGSAYSLGHVEFTPIGLISKAPAAVIVAIFRPFPWEVSSPIMLLAALESLVMLILSLRMFWLFFRNPKKGLYYLNNNSTLFFMFVFSIIFAFSVGFTSYNFGALSRYRIPLIPFYFGAMMLVSQYMKGESEVIEKLP